MTLRQVYYQLVSRQVIENKDSQYKRLSPVLAKARKRGMIPWGWIEDRARLPGGISMWQNLSDFIDTVKRSYHKDIWENQPIYFEIWLEKDALSGIFSDITDNYGVILCVNKGYGSWSAYREAVNRFSEIDKPVKILYFGDFDPSGEDMLRALEESLAFFKTRPEIEKVCLTMQDIKEYNLPSDPAKKTDTRAKSFIEKHGDIAVALDALPSPVLQQKIKQCIEDNLAKDVLEKTREIEKLERKELADVFNK